MSRRRAALKREFALDAKYNDRVVAKFINCIMFNGQKSTAESIFYKALEKIERRTNQSPLRIFHEAVDNVKPVLEVRSRRVGGATYQVPVEVRSERRQTLAFRWIIENARKRTELSMIDRLSSELLDALSNKGGAVKKREDTHRMAEANKAFAHYRW